MDIHYNELPFKVSFKYKKFSNGNTTSYTEYVCIKQYSDQILEVKVQDLDIKELIETWVKFEVVNSSNQCCDAALYIDGIDSLLPTNIEFDKDREPYIAINTEVPLYVQHDNVRSYPWIPGNYRIRVIWDNKEYYSMIKVHPKNIDEDSLKIMRIELERSAFGLSREFIRKQKGLDTDLDNSLFSTIILDKVSLIRDEFKNIMYSLNEILKKSNYEVVKQYSIKPFHKVTKIDTKSNKWLQSEKSMFINSGNVNKPEYLLAPYTVLCYDTQVNRWIKYIVTYIKDILKNCDEEIIKIKEYYHVEIEEIKKFSKKDDTIRGSYIKNRENTLLKLQQLMEEVTRMVSSLNLIIRRLNELEVGELKLKDVPLLLTRDHNYSYIYNIYRKLYKSANISLDNFYEFQWKATDLLYEYWCYLKVIECLKGINYELVSGWIYNTEYEDDYYVPAIIDGTTVQMKNEYNKLNIVFNKHIPLHEGEARKLSEPFFSRSVNNKPDIRIDVYDLNNNFIKTIILDAKYRPSKNIWNNKMAHTYFRIDTMNQLDEYSTKFYDVNNFSRNVVEIVIALCPTQLENNQNCVYYEQHSISLVLLRPGERTDHLSEIFKKYIEVINFGK